MYFGVERDIVLMNAAVLVLAVAGMNWWWTIIPAFVFNLIMRNINKKDPMTLKVYGRYRKQGWRYDPWPHRGQRSATLRPQGFMRDTLC